MRYPRASSVDAFAVLMHYREARSDTGIALLRGESFGYRHNDRGFMLRATLGHRRHPPRYQEPPGPEENRNPATGNQPRLPLTH